MDTGRLVPLLAVALLVTGGAVVLLWPEEPPPAETPDVTHDSGMTDEQTIRLMEEIGYIQQED
ncbi:MAG: hypothetical protein H6739_07340 [Alphaproteobacteria bacterium]|nr:hypothetical protein [Alphaproteobacteria bacterium]